MRRILIVDDEFSVRSLLRDVLELEDYEVAEAEDGPSALAAMAQQRPDLVLLDIMMPGMSGIDVLAQVRADAGLSDVPSCCSPPPATTTPRGPDGLRARASTSTSRSTT